MKEPRITLLEILKHVLKTHTELIPFLQQELKLSEDYSFNEARNIVSLFSPLLKGSESQYNQDLFVLCQSNFKRDGYFVDFGATDGVTFSNTYLLETMFNWKGILVEPAKCWHDSLRSVRSSIVDTRCVWSSTGEQLAFLESTSATLSTVLSSSPKDKHTQERNKGDIYYVESVSLTDLLEEYNAPDDIDYISIDTEGSEYEIISNHDFSKFSFKFITVEHNFTELRERIFSLLTREGYQRRYAEMSNCDDWYIRSDLI
jgi:FkbM family methyltransferase